MWPTQTAIFAVSKRTPHAIILAFIYFFITKRGAHGRPVFVTNYINSGCPEIYFCTVIFLVTCLSPNITCTKYTPLLKPSVFNTITPSLATVLVLTILPSMLITFTVMLAPNDSVVATLMSPAVG